MEQECQSLSRGLEVDLLILFLYRSLGRLVSLSQWSCVRRKRSLPQFEMTEEDINELPKLRFTGSFGVINNPYDEDRYQSEFRDIQTAGRRY